MFLVMVVRVWDVSRCWWMKTGLFWCFNVHNWPICREILIKVKKHEFCDDFLSSHVFYRCIVIQCDCKHHNLSIVWRFAPQKFNVSMFDCRRIEDAFNVFYWSIAKQEGFSTKNLDRTCEVCSSKKWCLPNHKTAYKSQFFPIISNVFFQ
jgi:hypothetical protein